MNPQETQEEMQHDLYSAIAKGDLQSMRILQFCIVLIGLTRVGKSTVFNWLNNRPLIGVKDKGKIFYDAVANDDGAPMSASALSKTLIPNVVKYTDYTCIIDPAGFRDRRKHVGVFSVNCMIKMIFQNGKNFKFILVLSKTQIQNQKDVLDTVYHFINLFDYQNLEAHVKQELLNSVALIITRAGPTTEDQDVQDQIKALSDQFSSPNYIYHRKQACIQVLNHIVERHMIGYFRIAQANKNSPPSDVLSIFQTRKLNYFYLSKYLSQNPAITVNGFEKEYKQMPTEEQQKYERAIETKLLGYKRFIEIIKRFIDNTSTNFYKKDFKYDQIFDEIDLIVDQFDNYNLENKTLEIRIRETEFELNKPEQTNEADTMKTMDIIHSVIEFTKIVVNISEDEQIELIRERMNILRQHFVKILKIIKDMCCRNRSEQIKFLNFSYILLRGFRQFTVIAEMDQLHCNDSDIKIKDYINSICQDQVQDIKYKMIKLIGSLTFTEKRSIFKKPEDFKKFLQFYDEFISDHGHSFPDQNKLLMDRNNEKLYYCLLILEKGNHKEALTTVIDIVSNLIEHKQVIKNQSQTDQIDDYQSHSEEIQSIENCFRASMKILGQILSTLKKYDYSIRIYQQIEQTHSICDVYEKYIETLSDPEEVKKISNDFSKFCIEHGRIQQGIIILQQYCCKLDKVSEVRSIKNQINGILFDRQQLSNIYRAINQDDKSFMKKEVADLEGFMGEIKEKIRDQSFFIIAKNNDTILSD